VYTGRELHDDSGFMAQLGTVFRERAIEEAIANSRDVT
jgi:hypothetical protein